MYFLKTLHGDGNMQFEFATTPRIQFGGGTVRQLGRAAISLGKRPLFVSNLPEVRSAPIIDDLKKIGLKSVPFVINSEPTVDLLVDGVELVRQQACDLIIGVGGGSAIDTGKAIAALATNQGDIYDYIEVIGKGLPIINTPLPMIAVPTTAGTGAEVTRNAVVGVPDHRVKVSLRSPLLLPKLAIVDPELTYGLPLKVTASTGVDALTQLIEPYVSLKANPLTDAICREGLLYIARSIKKAYKNDDHVAREEMSLGSLFGGLALANSGLGTVHGFASVLGGMFSIPHGMICARLLPLVMKANIHALETRMPESPALTRYKEVAQLLTGSSTMNIMAGTIWVQELCTQMGVSHFADFGITSQDFQVIIEKTTVASSTKANPIQLTDEELWSILEEAL
jgi:alcohol dehydrogenase class IV